MTKVKVWHVSLSNNSTALHVGCVNIFTVIFQWNQKGHPCFVNLLYSNFNFIFNILKVIISIYGKQKRFNLEIESCGFFKILAISVSFSYKLLSYKKIRVSSLQHNEVISM